MLASTPPQSQFQSAGPVCDGCTACCTLMGVPELHKPHHRLCAFSTGASCTIYEQRPDSCRDFSCVYRQGLFGEGAQERGELRPDKLGVMLYVAGSEQTALVAVEVWEGAFDAPAVQLLLQRCTEEGMRVVKRRGRLSR